MKKLFLGLILISSAMSLLARHNHDSSGFCSNSDGACRYQSGPVVSTTFCPTGGCPCQAKICKECESCPM